MRTYKVFGSYMVPDDEGVECLIHLNGRGIPYEEDEPNLGYSSEECNPRRYVEKRKEQNRVAGLVAG